MQRCASDVHISEKELQTGAMTIKPPAPTRSTAVIASLIWACTLLLTARVTELHVHAQTSSAIPAGVSRSNRALPGA